MKAVCVGDISIDHYINRNLKKPGGIAFNFAVNIIKAEENASLVTAVGSDKEGKKLKIILKKSKMNTSHLISMHGKTARQKIFLEKNGEKKLDGYDAGVLKHLKLNGKNLEFIAGHDVIFVPLSDGMEHIFHEITMLKTNAIKVTDLSQDYKLADFDKENNIIKKYCKFFDINFIGATEKQIPFITNLSKKHSRKIFVLTLGKRGSIGFLKGKKFVQLVRKLEKVVDTTGCGDAFQAAFLVSYLKTKDISYALQHATEQAIKVLQHVGSTTLTL